MSRLSYHIAGRQRFWATHPIGLVLHKALLINCDGYGFYQVRNVDLGWEAFRAQFGWRASHEDTRTSIIRYA